MNITQYRQHKLELLKLEPRFRQICGRCRQPDFSCFCEWVKPFESDIEFIILIHPIEYRRRIATGRLSHMILKNSRLIMGEVFGFNSEVSDLIRKKPEDCLLLYPGRQSLNLTDYSFEERNKMLPHNKKIFVIDGTWGTAKKMVNQSPELSKLKRICFTPPTPSNFQVRKQPRPNCYSTIEAIHHTLELLAPEQDQSHHNLREAFENMVRRQLDLKYKA